MTMEDLPIIYRGPSQSVRSNLTVSQIQGKPWTTWLNDYSRLAGENQALQREKAELQAQIKAMSGKKKRKSKNAHV